jgi:hypothetical protein
MKSNSLRSHKKFLFKTSFSVLDIGKRLIFSAFMLTHLFVQSWKIMRAFHIYCSICGRGFVQRPQIFWSLLLTKILQYSRTGTALLTTGLNSLRFFNESNICIAIFTTGICSY